MSSAEDDSNDGFSAGRDAKKRRVQRACDMCRRKKVRCDGGQMPGNRCSNCIAYNMECTYVESAKKRGPPKGYVEGLETRLEKMEALLNQLCPNADFTKELGPPMDRENWARDRQSSYSEHHVPSVPVSAGRDSAAGFALSPPNTELEPSDDEEALQVDGLADQLQDFHVGYRFFGKSSGVHLIKTALDLKSEYSGREPDDYASKKNFSGRKEFWSMHPWEVMTSWHASASSPPHTYTFPEPDLFADLVNLYFEYQNSLYPLLHRPTFENAIREGLHMRDESTGAVVVLVCAVGSRYSNDPRVRLDGVESWGSSGWRWFSQVRMTRRSFLTPPTLSDVQVFCLACIFLQGCSAPQVCWTLCGVGIRLAQDVGAHRKKVYSSTPTVQDELWRRAFWVLVAIDRAMSASLGRPCAIQEEDFDLDFPIDCDDEYWEHPDPNQAFKQPPGKPSKVSFFISHIRLNQILSFALRTIYSINKSKALLGFVGPEWEQRIVAELDSTLNKWLDEIPAHIRWPPPADQPPLFFSQSAALYSEYYQLQIMVHRPFIPSAQKPSKLSFPSLAICTNAARACSHVVEAARKRFPGRPFPEFQLPSFTSAIVLLLHIWGHKRAGQSAGGVNLDAEMACVHHCMKTLQGCEVRWHTAGRLWDVLYELASVGELPLPIATPKAKRERDSDSPPPAVHASGSRLSPPSISQQQHQHQHQQHQQQHASERAIAGSRRALASQASSSSSSAPLPPIVPEPFLPVHTDELGGVGGSWFSGALPTHDPRMYAMAAADAGAYAGLPAQGTAATSYMQMHGAPPQPPPPPQQPQAGMAMGEVHPGMFDPLMVGMSAEGMTVQTPGVDMWSNVPSGYGFEDWDSYITTMSGMQQPDMSAMGQQQQPPLR